MISASVDTRAADQLLGRMADVLSDDRLSMGLAAELLADYETLVFATGGLGKWEPLDPATTRAKGSNRILVDTGALLRELTSPNNVEVSGDTAMIGSASEVAGYLKRGARGMPKRDPAPMPDAAVVRQWAEELLQLVIGQASR